MTLLTDPELVSYTAGMLDITAPGGPVEVRISEDRKVIWVNVNHICRLRVCRIEHEIALHSPDPDQEMYTPDVNDLSISAAAVAIADDLNHRENFNLHNFLATGGAITLAKQALEAAAKTVK